MSVTQQSLLDESFCEGSGLNELQYLDFRNTSAYRILNDFLMLDSLAMHDKTGISPILRLSFEQRSLVASVILPVAHETYRPFKRLTIDLSKNIELQPEH
jgi:hypothetical protein